jgi:hypothetical protein
MKQTQSPFNWQGQPSKLGQDKAFNGVHKAVSERAAAASKKELYQIGSVRPITAYGRAVLAKTVKAYAEAPC